MGLIISGLCKRYARSDQAHQALDNVGFAVEQGAFVTLLGPSGCGKSTLLNMIAGLDRPDAGRIEIAGRAVYDGASNLFAAPGDRNISMVFQSYAIWPHMTVRENVEFPLRHGRKRFGSDAEREAAVTRALENVHLTAFAQRPAPLLSGGQQQRVSLARAIAQNPAIILLDEPLSNLDANLRGAMQTEIRSIVTKEGVTAVYVTHDQKEALSMSDVIVVLNEGRIEQIGTPDEVYYRPASRFVANFMGAPNMVDATVAGIDDARDEIVAECPLGQVRIRRRVGDTPRAGDALTLVLKQEDFNVGDPGDGIPNRYTLPVVRRVFLGDRTEVLCAMGAEARHLSIYMRARGSSDGATLSVQYRPEDIHYFRGR